MSLLNNLLKLHGSRRPVEDFFTEVVAHILSARPSLLFDWLARIGVAADGCSLDYVSTQRAYSALDGHAMGSRPDLEIGLSSDRGTTRILVESKVGGSEGYTQLKRYAEALAEQPVDRRVLVYCTRDYDPKQTENFLEDCRTAVEFVPARWHTLYGVLGPHRDSDLINEACLFMEEHEMSQDGLFAPADLIALQRLPHALSVVKHTLWDLVATQVEAVLGKRPNERSSNAQLAHHGRYLLKIDMHDRWWFGLGFFLAPSGSMYPEVGGMLEVDPRSPRRQEILAAMEAIVQRPGWRGSALRVEGGWSKALFTKPLQGFLHAENHADALEQFFLAVLEELQAVRNDYSHLPWRFSDTDPQDSEEMMESDLGAVIGETGRISNETR